MNLGLEKYKTRLNSYYFTAVLSFIVAIVGFSYNTWRLEVSEDNSNIRTASFSVLTLLAEFEQNIFAAHYDQDKVAGSPRVGWVKVGLIADMSSLISEEVEQESTALKSLWSEQWSNVSQEQVAVDKLTMQIDRVRDGIKMELKDLQ